MKASGWGEVSGETAQRGGDEIGEADDGEERARNFQARPARTRHEMFDEKSYDEQQAQDDAADPPGDRGPAEMHGGFLKELKEEQARGGEERAGEQKSGTEDQGDAVLRALEAHEGDGGEDEG